jgi:hypothetical protein
VAALIDAGCMIMRLLRIVGLPLGRMTTVPSAEAAREKYREFAGAKCDSPLRRRLVAARMPPPRPGSRRVTHVPLTVPLLTRIPLSDGYYGLTARGCQGWPPERPKSTRMTFSRDGRLSGRCRAGMPI